MTSGEPLPPSSSPATLAPYGSPAREQRDSVSGVNGGGGDEALSSQSPQREVTTTVWSGGGFRRSYAKRHLRPAEAVLIDHHRDAFSGRVLELGCGGGRITGHLIAVAASVHAVDVADDMLDYCRRTYPGATFGLCDIRDLSGLETASADVVVAGHNLIDVFEPGEREAFLDGIHRVIAADGLLVFSSHNIEVAREIPGPIRNVLSRSPLWVARQLLGLPRSLRNRRALVPKQRFEADYAIVNDIAHEYSLLHYYIGRDVQERQLAEHGFELLECLTLDGATLARGQSAPGQHELHYAARRVGAGTETEG